MLPSRPPRELYAPERAFEQDSDGIYRFGSKVVIGSQPPGDRVGANLPRYDFAVLCDAGLSWSCT